MKYIPANTTPGETTHWSLDRNAIQTEGGRNDIVNLFNEQWYSEKLEICYGLRRLSPYLDVVDVENTHDFISLIAIIPFIFLFLIFKYFIREKSLNLALQPILFMTTRLAFLLFYATAASTITSWASQEELKRVKRANHFQLMPYVDRGGGMDGWMDGEHDMAQSINIFID